MGVRGRYNFVSFQNTKLGKCAPALAHTHTHTHTHNIDETLQC